MSCGKSFLKPGTIICRQSADPAHHQESPVSIVLLAMSVNRRISSAFLKRCQILDAARGLIAKDEIHPLPTFALEKHHFRHELLSASPRDFHSTLCDLIRNAKDRVCLASLYIGAAATDSHTQELELLEALSQVSSNVDVQIVMDQNRGMRQIPKDGSTTSSAQAVARAIHLQPNHQLHLCQVLPSLLSTLLPNPLNEVAGVFHIKVYIVDDTLILSGANLSEEYFVDRHDRYLMISNGGNGLVDFYAQMVDILCQHYSEPYHDGESPSTPPPRSDDALMQHLAQLFADTNPSSAQELLQDPNTVAVCIPTFQHSQAAPTISRAIPSDVDRTLALLDEAANETTSVQLSSAYLNPTPEFADALAKFASVDLLTAGRLSHGFRPNPKAGNKGKDWIPTVFDYLQQEHDIPRGRLLHWERPDWTFHAKGLWVQDQGDLLAAVVGSSNFGRRSFQRDMESNVMMVFPPHDDVHPQPDISLALQSEWQQLLDNSRVVDPNEILETAPPLPYYVHSLLPFIKGFF